MTQKANYQLIQANVQILTADVAIDMQESDLIVDAIYGTGFHGQLRSPADENDYFDQSFEGLCSCTRYSQRIVWRHGARRGAWSLCQSRFNHHFSCQKTSTLQQDGSQSFWVKSLRLILA